MNWQQHCAALDRMDSSDPRKAQALQQFVDAVGQQFLQGHQVVHNPTDNEVEMRGRWHGFPVRLKIDTSLDAQWDFQGQNPSDQTIYLHWDEDAVPAVGSFSGDLVDDWGGDSEEKVFFAKGLYTEAETAEMPAVLSVYNQMPAQVRDSLAQVMVGDKISKLYLYSGGNQWLNWDVRLHELPDPLNQVGRGVWLMGQASWGLQQIAPGAAQQAAHAAPGMPGAVHRHKCAYCTTLFVLNINQRCPNCGAPPQS